jgi:hypothetical protein
MAFDKTNTGTLSKNTKKEQENHSDYKGSINVNGTEHWFDAWIKEGPHGKFLSCKIGKPKEQSNFKARGDDEMPKQSPALDDVPF